MPDQRQERNLCVLLSEVEGKPAICFDTGLEPRSFARTKMSQSLIEKGYIVKPDGSFEVWMPQGVCEFGGHMRVWGKPVSGQRFDLIIDQIDDTTADETKIHDALTALTYWIKAKISLKGEYSTLNTAAAFINSDGTVFFAPPNLAGRCLFAEGIELDRYNCPDLIGLEAAAFCAGSLLYKIFTKKPPFISDESIFQDMREGNFLPPYLASPGLNKNMCDLIQQALLLPVEKKSNIIPPNTTLMSGQAQDILNGMLNLLIDKNENKIKPVSSFIDNLNTEEIQKLEKNKKRFIFRQNIIVKTGRFITKNKYPVFGAAIGFIFILFIVVSTTSNMKRRPTTADMLPDSVVFAYYNAFSSLDHAFMEACAQGSDSVIKNDINAVASLYAIAKTRQSYENTPSSPIISARLWKESGGELPAPDVFGITDLQLEFLAGNDREGMMIFRVNYNLWAPGEHARGRTDTLTLRKDRRNNWRITEIIRIER